MQSFFFFLMSYKEDKHVKKNKFLTKKKDLIRLQRSEKGFSGEMASFVVWNSTL